MKKILLFGAIYTICTILSCNGAGKESTTSDTNFVGTGQPGKMPQKALCLVPEIISLPSTVQILKEMLNKSKIIPLKKRKIPLLNPIESYTTYIGKK